MRQHLICLATAFALGAGVGVHAEPVPTAVLQAAPERAGFVLTGALQALRQSTVAAQTSGNVLELAVTAGDRVRAGQRLARIDERSAQAGLAAADAGMAQAEALLVNARAHAERTRELQRQGFVSQAASDMADAQLRAALAGQDQARAGRTQAALARSFTTVTAPFDAVVLATHVEAGDLAAPGRALVTLYAPGHLRAVVQVPSTRSALAQGASKVEVQLPDGRWVAPASRSELPAADPVAQTVEWRLDLKPEAAAPFAPGQSVLVRFAGAATAGLPVRPLLPAAAVLQRGELSAVYAVQDGRFVLRPVRLGATQGEAGVEVLAGLKAGERFALDAVRAGLAGATPAN
ncbi:MAG: efflux RND transporter periplasmic adaptor subunit [Rubrivivax sp.]|nr:efflux RND transporter periplasmic adaptor subunit [Rubrivivax sp.]